MCGIAGVFHFGDRLPQPVDPAVLVRMRDRMIHRGPDGEGLWTSDHGRVGLAFRRLSILDLSEQALQPMANEDGRVRITFNGEIYNHLDLRRQLVAAGHTFRTDHSDTEVIVHGYEEWGIEGLLQRLEGMFGIAIWDDRSQRLHLVRDRIGIKPVYWSWVAGERLLWASEIKGILAHPEAPRGVEHRALLHYLTFMTTPAPLTMFEGIFKLPAGHRLEVAVGGVPAVHRWWDLAEPGSRLFTETDERFYIQEIQRLLEGSVERHMMSDVPYGAFLSGGVDSSTNVALMKKYSDRTVHTFTVGFSDHTHLNELEHADRVAKLFGTQHHQVLIQESDMLGYLDQLVHTQDEPLADWVCIPLYFVSKLVRDSGVTVVQVGEGSDEQFCGYGSYMAYLKLQDRYARAYRLLPKALQRAGAGLVRRAAGRKLGLAPYAELLERIARDREVFWTGAHVFNDDLKHRLIPEAAAVPSSIPSQVLAAGLIPEEVLAPDSFAIVQAQRAGAERLLPGADYLSRMTYAEFQTRLPELLLMRVDKITMSTSIESRVPFLDHNLVAFSFRIPQAMKTRHGISKYLMKKVAESYLPHDLVHRKKMGFAAPMSQWLQGDFGARVEAELLASPLFQAPYFNRDRIAEMLREHRSGRLDNSTQIWTLYNVAAWHRHWFGTV
jgi:asparagine synthase (glutamine-hydrolysing)